MLEGVSWCRQQTIHMQWRRQDLLRGGAEIKLCLGALTVDFGAGYSSCSMTNSFVTNAVLIERAVSCWHMHQLISQTTQYLDSWLSDLEVKRGHVPQCPIAGDATVHMWFTKKVLFMYLPQWGLLDVSIISIQFLERLISALLFLQILIHLFFTFLRYSVHQI